MQWDLVQTVSQSFNYRGLHIDSTRACARTLWTFHKNKCRSVYSLNINLLEHFSSDTKCRLFVGKIWVIFSSYCIAFYEESQCVLRCFALHFAMKCIVFYEAIGVKISQKRLHFYVERVAFLYRNAYKTQYFTVTSPSLSVS